MSIIGIIALAAAATFTPTVTDDTIHIFADVDSCSALGPLGDSRRYTAIKEAKRIGREIRNTPDGYNKRIKVTYRCDVY